MQEIISSTQASTNYYETETVLKDEKHSLSFKIFFRLRPLSPHQIPTPLNSIPPYYFVLTLTSHQKSTNLDNKKYLILRIGSVQQTLHTFNDQIEYQLPLVNCWSEVLDYLTLIDITSPDLNKVSNRLEISPLMEMIRNGKIEDPLEEFSVFLFPPQNVSEVSIRASISGHKNMINLSLNKFLSCNVHTPEVLSDEMEIYQNDMDEGIHLTHNFTHNWRLSVDCIAILLPFNAQHVYIRYQFPDLDYTKPYLSHPGIDCRKNEMFLIENGFCSYKFKETNENIISLFRNHPLYIQIWSRDEYKKDILLGDCSLWLELILDQPILWKMSNSKQISYRSLETCQDISFTKRYNNGGTIRCQFFLEDLGPLSNNEEIRGLKNNQIEDTSSNEAKPQDDNPYELSEPSQITQSISQREKGNDKAKMDLQILTHSQQDDYKCKLQELERQKEEVSNSYKELQQLDNNLKKKSHQIQKYLDDLESQIFRCNLIKEELDQRMNNKMEEQQSKLKCVTEEFNQLIELEKHKNRELLENNKKLKAELENSKEQSRINEEQINSLKSQLLNIPCNLQSDLKLKTFEVKDLTAKLEVMTESRDHFRNNCTSMLEQLNEARKDGLFYKKNDKFKQELPTYMEFIHKQIKNLERLLIDQSDKMKIEKMGNDVENKLLPSQETKIMSSKNFKRCNLKSNEKSNHTSFDNQVNNHKQKDIDHKEKRELYKYSDSKDIMKEFVERGIEDSLNKGWIEKCVLIDDLSQEDYTKNANDYNSSKNKTKKKPDKCSFINTLSKDRENKLLKKSTAQIKETNSNKFSRNIFRKGPMSNSTPEKSLDENFSTTNHKSQNGEMREVSQDRTIEETVSYFDYKTDSSGLNDQKLKQVIACLSDMGMYSNDEGF